MAGLQPPRISGSALRALATLARTHAGALALKAVFRRDLGIDRLDKLPDAWRGPFPLDASVVAGRAPRQLHDAELGAPKITGWPSTHVAFGEAFARGASPVAVAKRALAEARRLADLTPSLGPLMTYEDERAEADARASEERHRRRAPKSALDGVPVIVKEEYAIRGVPVRVGTSALPNDPAADDAALVAALREAGAIILGHTPMTEYGMSPLGQNVHRKMPRNPHDREHLPGGSSTGSGVGVATGIAPVAVAADGGGSIRIPACLNGVFGMKPTFGRISRRGDGFAGSMNHPGPIGASTADLAAFLEVTSGKDDRDPLTRPAPEVAPGSLVRALGRGVRGVRIGVLDAEIDDASPEVAKAVREALAALEREGATLVPLKFEFARYAASIGYIVIATETFADTREVRLHAGSQLGADLQITFGAASAFSAGELGDALRLRAGLRLATAELLRDVDVLALPTTATTAPAVTDLEMATGFVDARALDAMCRFAFLANLTGLPACTCPIGLGADRLPLGLQIVGDAWDEATVLAVAAHLERIGAARVLRPQTAIDLLEGL